MSDALIAEMVDICVRANARMEGELQAAIKRHTEATGAHLSAEVSRPKRNLRKIIRITMAAPSPWMTARDLQRRAGLKKSDLEALIDEFRMAGGAVTSALWLRNSNITTIWSIPGWEWTEMEDLPWEPRRWGFNWNDLDGEPEVPYVDPAVSGRPDIREWVASMGIGELPAGQAAATEPQPPAYPHGNERL